MQDVGTQLHAADIVRGGVSTLAVGDGVNEAVLEFLASSQEVRLHKVHHGVICREGEERNMTTFEQLSFLFKDYGTGPS